jgi:hypothetical protein
MKKHAGVKCRGEKGSHHALGNCWRGGRCDHAPEETIGGGVWMAGIVTMPLKEGVGGEVQGGKATMLLTQTVRSEV